jgi:hypothetical protein
MIEILSPMEIDQNMDLIFLTMKIFNEKCQVEIIIMRQKLIEKYENLAREALSSGDKILSENYFQHADHFTRILNEQEAYKKARYASTNELNKELPEDNVTEEEVIEEESKSKVVSEKRRARNKSSYS